jgi:hypothetical protein
MSILASAKCSARQGRGDGTIPVTGVLFFEGCFPPTFLPPGQTLHRSPFDFWRWVTGKNRTLSGRTVQSGLVSSFDHMTKRQQKGSVVEGGAKSPLHALFLATRNEEF